MSRTNILRYKKVHPFLEHKLCIIFLTPFQKTLELKMCTVSHSVFTIANKISNWIPWKLKHIIPEVPCHLNWQGTFIVYKQFHFSITPLICFLSVFQLQFIIVLAFMLQLYFFPTCKVSKVLLLINFMKAGIFFVMFVNFYSSSYTGKRNKLASVTKLE